MDERHANAREQFFAAIRTLAASADSIQTRVIEATQSILEVTIDEFEGDSELKIKFARILDLLAIDQDDMEKAAEETAAHMTDFRGGQGCRSDMRFLLRSRVVELTDGCPNFGWAQERRRQCSTVGKSAL